VYPDLPVTPDTQDLRVSRATLVLLALLEPLVSLVAKDLRDHRDRLDSRVSAVTREHLVILVLRETLDPVDKLELPELQVQEASLEPLDRLVLKAQLEMPELKVHEVTLESMEALEPLAVQAQLEVWDRLEPLEPLVNRVQLEHLAQVEQKEVWEVKDQLVQLEQQATQVRVDSQEFRALRVSRGNWAMLAHKDSRVPLARVERPARWVRGVMLAQQAVQDLREIQDHLEAKVSKVQLVLRVREVKTVSREQLVSVECLVNQVTLAALGRRVPEVKMDKLEPQALLVPLVLKDLQDPQDPMVS